MAQLSNSETTRQDDTARVAALMPLRMLGAAPLALVRTYGCQQNVADGEKLKGQLAEMGFAFTDDPEAADLILFNTCAVREHAEDRVFGNVGALKGLKHRHPKLILALCGCMMEQEHVAARVRESYPYVDLVFGTHVLHLLPGLLLSALQSNRRVFSQGGASADETIVEGLPLCRGEGAKAWLTVMYGCDNFCSYCVVPYVRGRERSREPQAVLEEFKGLVAAGYKDITLLGQNVNSYGKGLAEPTSFAQLLQLLDAVPGDHRIRFMTSHPKDATRELLDTMAAGTHICRHLHLPVQSGCNRVLAAMNRRYTRERYLELVRYAREKMPDISITSDVIVGFPGETHEEFLDTLSLVREVGFTSLYTFIYSPRAGTAAAKLPDETPHEEKARRLQALCNEQEAVAALRCASMVGTLQTVLAESKSEKSGLLSGRTGGGVIVDFPGDAALIGSFAQVEITAARNWILTGRLLEAGR